MLPGSILKKPVLVSPHHGPAEFYYGETTRVSRMVKPQLGTEWVFFSKLYFSCKNCGYLWSIFDQNEERYKKVPCPNCSHSTINRYFNIWLDAIRTIYSERAHSFLRVETEHWDELDEWIDKRVENRPSKDKRLLYYYDIGE